MGYAETTNRIGSYELNENAYDGVLLRQDPLSFSSQEDLDMYKQDNNIKTSNLLLDAASVWKELSDYRYEIIYGYKRKLYEINLSFNPEEFQHLAGFQYLKDITLPRYNSSVTLKRILDRKITFEQIIKSSNYESMVKPRLEAISKLNNILDNDFRLFSYMPKMYSFSTTIKAEYIISYHFDKNTFVFIVKLSSENEKEYVCCSSFTEGDRNYEENQRQRTILKKSKIKISSDEIEVLYDRLNKVK